LKDVASTPHRWNKWVERVNPDIVVLTAGAHIYRDYERVVNTVLKEIDDMRRARPGIHVSAKDVFVSWVHLYVMPSSRAWAVYSACSQSSKSSARGSTPTEMYTPCLQIWWKTQSPAGCTAGISDRLWWGPESTLTKDPAFNYNGTVDSHQHASFFNRDAWTKARMRQHEVCALAGVLLAYPSSRYV
jgi:hypothetical protein